MIKDCIKILKLVNRLAELDHPIVINIRWEFCQFMSRYIAWKEKGCWDGDYEKWKKTMIAYPHPYGLFAFFRKIGQCNRHGKVFRKGIILFLTHELDNTEGPSLQKKNHARSAG